VNETPAIRRRLVGAALRRYRDNSGFKLEDAAQILECDRSKISRIETGQRGIRNRDLRELLAEYGAGEREQAVLAAIANPGRAPGWWRDYGDVLAEDVRDMMIMESLATQIFAYHAQQVPELLQTGDYARAVAGASGTPPAPGSEQRAMAAMLARQEAIVRAAKEPELAVVIAEGALRQQVGGPEVMRAQLARLADLAVSSPRITVQVLPFAAGAHPAFGAGGLMVLTFAETPDLGIVHIPGVADGIYLQGQEEVACHAAAFGRIRDAALSVPESASMLRTIAGSPS
jgi:transcriptional regulator with XRE-family HTH domain